MDFHPYSEIFPWLEGAELDELAADIKANGLREPIWLYEGQILDGRNRFAACGKANVKPDYRLYEGDDPLAFVVSVNVHRRHLTASQRAMAAAEIATLSVGRRKSNASIEAFAQSKAADSLNVGRSSVQRARKVIEEGSTALKKAVKTGAVAVSKAAAVVDLPKREQLAAATATTELDDGWVPEEDEERRLEIASKEYADAIDKVMASDDKLATAHAEIKRQGAEIAVLRISRDGYMDGKAAITKLLKSEQRKVEKKDKEIQQLKIEIERLRERVAVIEEAA